MAWGLGPSINRYGGRDSGDDCWRTWFIEECEESNMFGLTHKHLPLVRLASRGVVPYHVGTRLYLEDAPYFHKSKKRHRLLGPYLVNSTNPIPASAKPIYIHEGKVIVYEDAEAARGPWLNRTRCRDIDDLTVHYRQTASPYNYFPLRFRIERAKKGFSAEYIPHEAECWLCR
jgi:hypothetical protein